MRVRKGPLTLKDLLGKKIHYISTNVSKIQFDKLEVIKRMVGVWMIEEYWSGMEWAKFRLKSRYYKISPSAVRELAEEINDQAVRLLKGEVENVSFAYRLDLDFSARLDFPYVVVYDDDRTIRFDADLEGVFTRTKVRCAIVYGINHLMNLRPAREIYEKH